MSRADDDLTDERTQGISSHVIDLVCPEYSSITNWMVQIRNLAIKKMPQDLTGDKSTLFRLMAAG